MVIAEALSTGQTGNERSAFGPTLSTDSRRGDCLPRNQTAGNLLPLLCTHRDGCHEDRRIGWGVRQILNGMLLSIFHEAAETRGEHPTKILEELLGMR